MYVYNFPKDTEYVFLADFFAEDLVGGAELTLQAIIDKCPGKSFKLHSSHFNSDLLEKGKNLKWILGNFATLSREQMIDLATSGVDYSVIECDYKYCMFRSKHLHELKNVNEMQKLQTHAKFGCTCHMNNYGRFMVGFFKRSSSVHFMSQGQLDEYLSLFPKMRKWPTDKLIVQGSTFDSKTLDNLDELYHNKKENNGKWAVLAGGTWIKNQQETELYCKRKNLDYELIGGMSPQEFLKKLSEYKGLVFHPKGFDTNPRITIEAKLLGLELDLNDNVQQRHESWFAGSRENCMTHLRDLPEKFWRDINYGKH